MKYFTYFKSMKKTQYSICLSALVPDICMGSHTGTHIRILKKEVKIDCQANRREKKLQQQQVKTVTPEPCAPRSRGSCFYFSSCPASREKTPRGKHGGGVLPAPHALSLLWLPPPTAAGTRPEVCGAATREERTLQQRALPPAARPLQPVVTFLGSHGGETARSILRIGSKTCATST